MARSSGGVRIRPAVLAAANATVSSQRTRSRPTARTARSLEDGARRISSPARWPRFRGSGLANTKAQFPTLGSYAILDWQRRL